MLSFILMFFTIDLLSILAIFTILILKYKNYTLFFYFKVSNHYENMPMQFTLDNFGCKNKKFCWINFDLF